MVGTPSPVLLMNWTWEKGWIVLKAVTNKANRALWKCASQELRKASQISKMSHSSYHTNRFDFLTQVLQGQWDTQ